MRQEIPSLLVYLQSYPDTNFSKGMARDTPKKSSQMSSKKTYITHALYK